jgi:hypothetical protein
MGSHCGSLNDCHTILVLLDFLSKKKRDTKRNDREDVQQKREEKNDVHQRTSQNDTQITTYV